MAIYQVADVLNMPEFAGANPDWLTRKLAAIEQLVHSYTNNNFTVRQATFTAPALDGDLYGIGANIKVSDTVLVTDSALNNGIYVVEAVDEANYKTTLDRQLLDDPFNRCTLVQYPWDVKAGVIDLLLWEKDNRGKVGVKSESLSRHDVTYYDMDANNSIAGYPAGLMAFLKPYRKARF